MSDFTNKINRFFRQLAGLVPTAVPVGVAEFHSWADSIINTYSIPADSDSIKFALATMILHSGPKAAYRSKFEFFLMLRSGMSKQIAGAIFQEIKIKQQELARSQAEATAVLQAASDVQQSVQQ